MSKLSASILSADFGRLAEHVRSAEQAGVDWIHVDVMDGHFVPNLTIGPAVTQALRRATALPLDVHLMISNPERYVEAFAEAGADWLGVHVEATVHLERLIQQIKETGAKATVTLNPATPLDCLEYVLKDVDMVLLMTVNPGFSGQKFIPGVLPKIRRLRRMIDEQEFGRSHPGGRRGAAGHRGRPGGRRGGRLRLRLRHLQRQAPGGKRPAVKGTDEIAGPRARRRIRQRARY